MDVKAAQSGARFRTISAIEFGTVRLVRVWDQPRCHRAYAIIHRHTDVPFELPGLFPHKVTILIDGNYISIDKSPDTHSEGQAGHGSAEAVNQVRPFHESRRNDQRPDEDDNLSEDSDARRITKKSTMEVNGHTFEIYGKTAIRENLIKSTGIRRLMQTGHMVTLLKTSGHGSYGNTITAANIIDGVIKLADDNNATLGN